MTDSNITSRLRKLRFGRRVSPTRSVPTPSKASSVSSQKSKTQLAKIDIYRPLSPSTREIRLLHILPEQPGSLLLGPDPISCVLSHVSLDEKPTYHALSYTWDDESLGQSFEDPDDVKRKKRVLISGFIFLDGQAVEVTPNLWVALWHLRRGANWFKQHPDAEVGEFGQKLDKENPPHFTYETPIWVDALCINQLDVLERNEQVQMMGLLYKSAQCVHSWTGLEIPDIGLFIEMMQTSYEKFNESEYAAEEVGRILQDEDLRASWIPMPLICERPYWNRLWIVQEYLLGRRCAVTVGLRSFDSIQFTWLARTVARAQADFNSRPIFDMTPNCETILTRQSTYGWPALSKVLPMFWKHKCSDPRDKIYGVLGLGGRADYGVMVDYTLDADTVYQNAIRQIILKDQDLDLIFNPQRYALRCLDEVPVAITISRHCSPAGNQPATISVSQRGHVLICKGFSLGTIERINVNKVDQRHESGPLLRDLAVFASTVPDVLANTETKTLPERLEILYGAMTLNNDTFYSALIDRAAFIRCCVAAVSDDPSQPTDEEANKIRTTWRDAALFSLRFALPAHGATDKNLSVGPVFGRSYPFCKEGDTVAALYGCPKLAVLRPDPANPGRFKVMCEAYVHGFMNGEGLGLFEEREFELT